MSGAGPRTVGGRYRLDRPIGRGGMGQVWAGTDERLGRTVAVKLIRGDLDALAAAAPAPEDSQDGSDLRARFDRECRTAARLDHPGIVSVHDAGVDDDGRLYLVMQYVEGVGLSDLVGEEGPLPVDQAAAVACQLAAALSAVHAAGVVHRDVKPGNAIVRPDGRVVLLDLGISAAFEPELSRLTRSGTPLGTPSYMAPEQAVSGALEPRSDLYALGCLLHAVLTGEPPFTGPSALAVMHGHYWLPPRPLRDVRPDVPPELERLTLDLLAKSPDDRPSSAAEVYERLLPLLPGPAGAGSPLARPGPRPDPTRPYRFPGAPIPPPPAPPTATRAGDGAAPPVRAAAPAPEPGAPGPDPGAAPVAGTTATSGAGNGSSWWPAAGASGAAAHGIADTQRIAQALLQAAELHDQGRYGDAAAMVGGAVAQAGAVHGANTPQVLALRRRRAQLLMKDQQFGAALAEFSALAGTLAAARGRDDPEAMDCGYLAARCQARAGDAAGALSAYRGLLAVHQERAARGLPADPDRARRIRLHIGELLMTTRDLTGAWDVLLGLLMELEPALGPQHPRVREVRTLLDWLQPLRFGGAGPVPDAAGAGGGTWTG